MGYLFNMFAVVLSCGTGRILMAICNADNVWHLADLYDIDGEYTMVSRV